MVQKAICLLASILHAGRVVLTCLFQALPSLHYSLVIWLLSCIPLYQIEVTFLQQIPKKGGTYLVIQA